MIINYINDLITEKKHKVKVSGILLTKNKPKLYDKSGTYGSPVPFSNSISRQDILNRR